MGRFWYTPVITQNICLIYTGLEYHINYLYNIYISNNQEQIRCILFSSRLYTIHTNVLFKNTELVSYTRFIPTFILTSFINKYSETWTHLYLKNWQRDDCTIWIRLRWTRGRFTHAPIHYLRLVFFRIHTDAGAFKISIVD